MIVHRRLHKIRDEGGPFCPPGEEVVSAMLLNRAKEYALRLSPSSLVLFDYLVSHRLPQSARQIAVGVSDETFHVRRAANAPIDSRRVLSLQPRSIKVYVQRIRKVMQSTFDEAGLRIDPSLVLRSETTDTRLTLYRLAAFREWLHLP